MNDPKIFALMREEKIRRCLKIHLYFTRADIEAGFDGLDFNTEKAFDSLIKRVSGTLRSSIFNDTSIGKYQERRTYEQSRD